MHPTTTDDVAGRRNVPRAATGVVLILIASALGIGAYQVIIGKSSGRPALAQRIPIAQEAPYLVRTGERIMVPAGSPLRNKLTIEAVGEKKIRRTLSLPATVEADPARLVKILPPLAGRITSLKVQLGGRVEAGQELAVLDSPDLAAAYADFERAKVLLALALKNRDRQRELAKFGGTALRDQQQAETDYITAEVEQQRAAERLRQIGVDPQTTSKSRTVTITSPIAGSVIELAVAPGAYWNDANAPLMTIADLSTVWVTANVPEKDTALIAKGQSVDVAFVAYPERSAKGEGLFVSDVLDPDTRRTKVRIAFKNDDLRLKPNMFANVTFLAPMRLMPLVPMTALMLKNEGEFVFVEVEPWTFVARPVDISFQDGDQAVIAGGVKAGERVVVKGGVLLND